jgi:hypothetical protein
VHGTVAEAGLDAFLEAVGDVHFARQAEHGDGRLFGLGDVEEVVEERLPGVGRELVELVEHEDHGDGGPRGIFVCVWVALFGLCLELVRVRQHGKDRLQRVREIGRLGLVVALQLHLNA